MQTHALAFARDLHARGHELVVLTYRHGTRIEHAEAPAFDASLPFPVHRVLNRLSHERNLDIASGVVAEFGPDLVYASTIFFGELSERCGVPVTARSVGNDVLRPWIVYPYKTFARLVASPLFEERAYSFFRNLDYPEFVESLWLRARRRRMEESARRHSAVFANSAFTSGLLEGVGVPEERIHPVVGGVDARAFDAVPEADVRASIGVDADAWMMMTACRLVRKKAVDFLIDVMPRVVEHIPNAHLVIVGGGRREKHLRRRAAASPAADRITFAGRIPHEEVKPYFTTSDVFVLASREYVDPRTGLKDAETMGRVLCEANAAGVPVVAARSGGIPSVIEDGGNGLLFAPDDPESFLTVLTRLHAAAELRERLVARGKELAEESFDFKHVVNDHLEAFYAMLSEEDYGLRQRSRADDSPVSGEVRVVLDA